MAPDPNYSSESVITSSWSYAVEPERVKAKDIAIEVTKGVLTLAGKCGKQYSISLKGWEKLVKAVDFEIAVAEKAENGTKS
jgi:hypothetical protein